MSLAVLFIAAALLDGQPVQVGAKVQTLQQSPQSNHQVIRPPLDRLVPTMDRFTDNDARMVVMLEREAQYARYRQAVINQRVQLADQLDVMIAAGQCEAAKANATRAGYRDIREAVIRVCDARAAD
jgi:hypothetical protein